jgi:hypothetical protein
MLIGGRDHKRMASEMEEIKSIVDALNREPFSMKLTLVTFHRKSPLELLQVHFHYTHCFSNRFQQMVG